MDIKVMEKNIDKLEKTIKNLETEKAAYLEEVDLKIKTSKEQLKKLSAAKTAMDKLQKEMDKLGADVADIFANPGKATRGKKAKNNEEPVAEQKVNEVKEDISDPNPFQPVTKEDNLSSGYTQDSLF